MSTHVLQSNVNTSYFTTFTCYKWLPLIRESNAYYSFYRWFNYLKSIEISIIGFVIMPNHFHGIFFVPATSKRNINKILSNGKRFIAYDIVRGLNEMKKGHLIHLLTCDLTKGEILTGKKHRVFITSSDIKEVKSINAVTAILNYIHSNPCNGKWMLSSKYQAYKHSSAGYYENNVSSDFLSHFSKFF